MARDRRHPYKHGFTPGTVVDARGMIPKTLLHVGGARSLHEFNVDYAFFTPAALYLSGFFADSLLIDFMTDVGSDVTFYHYRFNTKIFGGLLARDGDDAWNSVLWAVRRQFWEPLQSFLCSVTITKPSRRMVVGIGYQEFQVLDPLAMDRHRIALGDTSRLLVGAFGINGNQFIYAFEHGDPLSSLPRIRRYAAPADMGAFADALFAGRNPTDARSDYTRKYGA